MLASVIKFSKKYKKATHEQENKLFIKNAAIEFSEYNS
jgi:hypothetical protein